MAVIDEEKRKVAPQPGLGMPKPGQTISKYGTPTPMSPAATQAAVNQSAMYVEGAKAAAASRPPEVAPPPQPVAAPAPPAGPLDAQAASDQAAVAAGVGVLKEGNRRAGAAIADVGLLVPRALAGAYDSTVVRGMRAAGINAGYVSPMLNPASAPGSTSMTPYYDEIRAKDAAAQATSTAPAAPAAPGAPAAQAPAAAAVATSPAAPNPVTQAAPGGMPSPSGQQPVAPASTPGLGMVNVRRQPNGVMEFSGENISGPVSYQGAQAAGFKPRGSGGISVVPGMAPGEARAILDRPFDPRNAMSVEQRFQYDKEVKNAQGINAFNAGMNPRKTTIDDLLRSRLANSAAKRQATADQTEIARGTADLAGRRQAESELNSESERGVRANTVAESQQLQTARSEYLTADTDEKRNAAAKKLMALQGKSEANPGYTVVPGEEYMAPDGLTKLRGPSLVLDNRTGQVVDMASQTRAAEPGGAPKGARPEKYEVGKTYTVGDRKVRVVGLDAQGQPQFQEAQ